MFERMLSEATSADWLAGIGLGLLAWFVIRHGLLGFYTVNQDERAVMTSFGRAQRSLGASTVFTPAGEAMRASEKERYAWPQLRVIGPGGPYFRWPWQKVYKVSVATQTVNMAWDPEDPNANHGGQVLEAVTKDQLNVGLTGELRYRVAEENLYAYVFGVKRPIAHIMGFFISILRERIANFEAPKRALPRAAGGEAGAEAGSGAEGDGTPSSALAPVGPVDLATAAAEMPASALVGAVSGVSINDLRKNLRDLNEHMDRECAASAPRYGIILEASLITGIDPPGEVESALAAINTAYNQVSSDVSLAQALADQKIVQSRRAVEIETLKAQAEVEPLVSMAEQLATLKGNGPEVLEAYLRNVRLALYGRADQAIVEVK